MKPSVSQIAMGLVEGGAPSVLRRLSRRIFYTSGGIFLKKIILYFTLGTLGCEKVRHVRPSRPASQAKLQKRPSRQSWLGGCRVLL